METVNISTIAASHVDYTETYPVSFRQVKGAGTPTTLSPSDALYIKAGAIPDGIGKKRIVSTKISLYAKFNPYYNFGDNYVQKASVYVDLLMEPYDADKIISDHALKIAGAGEIPLYANQGYSWGSVNIDATYWGERAANAAKYGICIVPGGMVVAPSAAYPNFCDSAGVYPPGSSYAPYITLSYEDAVLTATAQTPSGGWVDRTKPLKLSWIPRTNGVTMEPVQQAAAVVRWKAGENGEVHTISLTAETEYTLPADTLPNTSDIMWQVQLTSDDGVTEPTPGWNTITTIDATPVVHGVSPSAGYIDGQGTIVFTWDYTIETGSEQRSYELQYKSASSDWTVIASAVSSDKSAEVSGDTFSSGAGEWRVRSANTDGVFSEWSSPLSFVVISAPKAPAVSVVLSAPRPVIAWQSKDQQAFEIQIGAYQSGTIFGTDKTYQCPIYLPDGIHGVRVRVLNEFNIWSPWGETAVTVQNTPGAESIALLVTVNIDAALTWTGIPEAAEYWLYRNDERIARVTGTAFTDRLYVGSAEYFVRAAHADGYSYTDSNHVQTEIKVDHAMITALDGDWLDIGLSLTSTPSVIVTRSRDVAMMQYNGAVLPVPEISPFESRTYSIDVAFADRKQAQRFEELLARLVCVKDQYENCVVGMLYSYTKTQNHFTTAFSAIVEEVDKRVYAGD